MQRAFMCRDVDNQEVDDARKVTATGPEHAAEEWADHAWSDHELYERRSESVRVGVRPLSESEQSYGFDVEAAANPETIYEVTWRLEPVFDAEAERFFHPLKPRRCFECRERADRHPPGWRIHHPCPLKASAEANP